jgi:nicotinate-nucleotide pyrophosphorylase
VPVTKAARVRVEILDARACPALSAVEVHATTAGGGTAKPGAAASAK